MPASFQWVQTVGAGGTMHFLGSSGNICNFMNAAGAGTSGFDSNPIPAGANSYEVWLQGYFYGTFNAIYDLRFWMSTNFTESGLYVYAKVTTPIASYITPTSLTSSFATTALGTSDPGTRNVGFGGSLTSSILAAGYTDFIVLQLRTDSNAPAGTVGPATFTLSYIES
jgi:hypothetical protein